jgi:osmotically-inducible protein OsmY
LLVLGITLALTPPCQGGDSKDWLPIGPPPDDSTAHDLELALRAREALLADPELRRSRLGVNVFHRRATLWGEVTTTELGERARRCLQRIVELQDIREEWHLAASDSITVYLPAPVMEQGSGTDRALRSLRVRGELVGRPDADGRALGRDLTWHPLDNRRRRASAEDASSLSPPPGQPPLSSESLPLSQKLRLDLGWRPGVIYPAPTRPHHESFEASSMALPMLRLAVPANGSAAAGSPANPAVASRPQPGPDSPAASPEADLLLQARIELLRRSDAHFARLRVDLSQGTVLLSGSASRWEHVYDLARAIARLPGVQRVVLKDVQAGS